MKPQRNILEYLCVLPLQFRRKGVRDQWAGLQPSVRCGKGWVLAHGDPGDGQRADVVARHVTDSAPSWADGRSAAQCASLQYAQLGHS